MPTRTPIPVSRAMRQISANLDLARRQQRIPVALLAERAGLSMPTVTKMLRTGNGSFENFLRIARLLGLLDGVQQATDPLNTDIGKLRATKTLQNVFDSTAGGATHHGSNRHPAVQRHRRHRREIIHQYQARHRIGTFHIRYGLYALSNAVSLCPEMPLSPGTFPAEHNAMHRIFQDCMPDRWGRNLMLRAEHQDARSEHRTARTLFEGDLLLSVNDETRQGALRFWNNDGDALAPSETGGPREVTIQSRIHSNDEQLL